MTSFRYQIAQGAGGVSEGVIEAPDRRAALQALAGRGVFPSVLEPCVASGPGEVLGPEHHGEVLVACRCLSRNPASRDHGLFA